MGPIWEFGGLTSDLFYAAAFYLSVVQQKQKEESESRVHYQKLPDTLYAGSPSESSPQLRNHAEIISSFLDRLSLLFARFRKQKTQQNVTAAGLIENQTTPHR
jgi:hypothetical protein